jgi:5-methyltetrahydropteroyltriglutamate--homocysteine methyltransferase
MKKSVDRILTTHTGSLPRGRELTALYADRQKGGAVDATTIARLGQESVRKVVAKQAAAGIDIGNDGEQMKDGFFLYLAHRLTGFGGTWQRAPRGDVERYPEFKRMMEEQAAAKIKVNARAGVPKAIGEVKYISDAPLREECRFFQETLDQNGNPFVEAFLTAPSPGIVSTAVKNEHYDTHQNYLEALGRALQIEYEIIVRNGYLLQIDAPDLGLERHISYAQQPLPAFLDFVERVIATINKALVNVPRDRVRLHVCWGNYEGPHDADVPLRDILPLLLKANVGGLVLPFANPQHAHDYTYLKSIPLHEDQILVAGVIDVLTNVIEHPEAVADRLQRVAEVIGDPSRVQAGTDCGFDTGAGGGRVAEDIVWAKLKALSDGARIASERLFGKAS